LRWKNRPEVVFMTSRYGRSMQPHTFVSRTSLWLTFGCCLLSESRRLCGITLLYLLEMKMKLSVMNTKPNCLLMATRQPQAGSI